MVIGVGLYALRFNIVQEFELAGIQRRIIQAKHLLSCTDIRNLVVEQLVSRISDSSLLLQQFPPLPPMQLVSNDGLHFDPSATSNICSALDSLPSVIPQEAKRPQHSPTTALFEAPSPEHSLTVHRKFFLGFLISLDLLLGHRVK